MSPSESPFAGWEVFNLIVGATAGALIGFQGLASALAADSDDGDEPATNAATVAHFSASLALCSLSGVPWAGETAPRVLWGICGLGGMLYVRSVAQRMQDPRAFGPDPDTEDLVFHLVLPFIAYLALSIASAWHLETGLFFVGLCALMLLLVGIHNAYDSVMFQVFLRKIRRK